MRRKDNAVACVCTWDPCGNKGVCCNCVRDHFSADAAAALPAR